MDIDDERRADEMEERMQATIDALVAALDGLALLTKFELSDNASRQPWKRALEKSDAALALARGGK